MTIHYRNILIVSIVFLLTMNILYGQEDDLSNFSLVGRWNLIAINGQSVSEETFSNGIPYIEIKEKDQIFSGFTGCNVIRGHLQISGDSIVIGKIISSKRYCNSIPENEFLDALKQIETYNLEGKTLFMLMEESRLLRFIKSE